MTINLGLRLRPLALLLALVLAGCVTPKVTERSVHTIRFGDYKTIHCTVKASPSIEIGGDERGYAREVTDLFSALVAARLQAIGYKVVESDADLTLNIFVTAAKPGSAATRFWVGFGAGRAIFTFDAAFTDAQGAALGSFAGGRSHTGMEFGQAFASKTEIESFAATRAADQVEIFIRNNGVFPEFKKVGS